MDSIWNESTTRPSLAISGFDASRTSDANFWRSRIISSTVIEPTIERRWPAKIRPTNCGMEPWSSKNLRPALAIDSGSSPTLNAITALTWSVMPCWVTQGSATSASCIARVRKEILFLIGMAKAPCPTTMRNGASPLFLLPEISIASLGFGTRQPIIFSASLLVYKGATDTVRAPWSATTTTSAPASIRWSAYAMYASVPPPHGWGQVLRQRRGLACQPRSLPRRSSPSAMSLGERTLGERTLGERSLGEWGACPTPTVSRPRRAPTCSSTPQTPWTGGLGEKRLSPKRAGATYLC